MAWLSSLFEGLTAAQLLLLGVLSGITIFRREISCNHCYNEDVVSATATAGDDDFSWNSQEAEELLDGAGLFCSGASVIPTVSPLWDLFCRVVRQVRAYSFRRRASVVPPKAITIPSTGRKPPSSKNVLNDLSLDAQLHILSFLSAKDVVNLSAVDRSMHSLSHTSQSLWKSLFVRDFGWVVEKTFPIGYQARKRSSQKDEPEYSRDFYFLFANCYTDFLLAGNASFESAWIGIRGSLYDMSTFLINHPGSPETVLVHAGREATASFGAIRHSAGARRLAQSLCMVVWQDGRLRPTEAARVDNPLSALLPEPVESPPVLLSSTNSRYEPAGLEKMRHRYRTLQNIALAKAQKLYSERSLTGDVNVFYDPFAGEWGAWYIQPDLTCSFEPLVECARV